MQFPLRRFPALSALLVPVLAHAREYTLAETAVLGTAWGLILGVLLVIYKFVWRPFKQKVLDVRKNAKIAGVLPKIVVTAAEGNLSAITALLDSGHSVDAQGPAGQTPLMLAARNGHAEAIKLLLERGADRSLRNKTGSTAADVARTYKHSECEEILVQKPLSSR
jgi:ankyrin repeat protein